MAYSTDTINATLNNYFKEGRRERILLWRGDPLWEKLYDQMEQQRGNSVKDHGRRFQFDVTTTAEVRTTQGMSGDINIGEASQTLVVGNDARAITHAAWAVQESDLTALNTPEQLGDYLDVKMTANGVKLQKYMAEQVLTGTSTDPDLGFAQLCTINGGDATPVTYTAADGTSRTGIINLQSEAAQIAAAITRHGISSADATLWVSRFVDNSAGSWAADTQMLNANELHMLCTEGAAIFSADGKSVMQEEPDLGICTFAGYNRYQRSLKAQVRYAKGEDNGSDQGLPLSKRSGMAGGLLFGANTPIYYCRTIDAAVTAGTAFVGYGGILWFLNTRTWGIRYVSSEGANPGSKRQRGRVWRFRLMPEEATKDRRVFKGSAEQQLFCKMLSANGGMKNWNQA